ncbi:hypothetical protein Q5741_16435 [Paenibacillus sp. JX-17]|uniref:Uncharacterized protein n=1 Tax=Paenibacillus lacisoli TaxID=3064525 RepID=A0ABT9CFE8_9BACL|nr:hypothetical protein [Paenibacillus sp. JX-17]MDO7908001.1 hypothetical protein [Paenibacillus sp. JX-17]
MNKKKSLNQKMQSMADKSGNMEGGKEHPTTNTNMGKFHIPNRPSV